MAEVSLKEYFSDKTNWRKMLQNDYEEVQWQNAINQAVDGLPDELKQHLVRDHEITELKFPVLKYPRKVQSLNLEKENTFTGVLKGIKGQYLIFEDQTVYNMGQANHVPCLDLRDLPGRWEAIPIAASSLKKWR